MAASLFIALAAVLFLPGQSSVLRARSTSSYTFAQYVRDFGRDYAAGSQEYASRAARFQASVQRVNAINAKNAVEGRSWMAGVHPFMDWSEAERRSLNGYKPKRDAGARLAALQTSASAGSQLNTSFSGAGTGSEASWEGVAMRQQGSCGSCWAISAAEAVEARLPNKERVAAQALVDCVPNPQHCGGKGGCDGATGELAYSFIRDHGIPLESNYAYTAETGSCPMNPLSGSFPAAQRARVSGWTNLPSNKAEPLKQALYNQGPVVVAVDANDWFDYDNGVFDGCKKDAELGHAVLAKGFGGEGNAMYWRIQNSWGANWGEQGHIRLKRQESAEEEAHCGQDRKPQDGLGCDGGPPEITVCGMCGILYDPIYPEGVTLESTTAEPAAAAAKPSFRGYSAFKPSEDLSTMRHKEDFDMDFSMPKPWTAQEVGNDNVVDSDANDNDLMSASSHPSYDDLLSAREENSHASPSQPVIFHPAESADKVKRDMEKTATEKMQDMLLRGQI